MSVSYTHLYRQATEQVERYTATGMRLLERTRDPVQQAQFQRLRGGLFCLQGAYDKSRYYLLEAMDALRGQPRSTAVRLQLALRQLCGRLSAHADKHAVTGQRCLRSGIHIPQPKAGQFVPVEQLGHRGVPSELHIPRLHQRRMVNLGRCV